MEVIYGSEIWLMFHMTFKIPTLSVTTEDIIPEFYRQ